jgi:hypothetical protein
MSDHPPETPTPWDRDTRPWGTWEVLTVGQTHVVKKIVVLPASSFRCSDTRAV